MTEPKTSESKLLPEASKLVQKWIDEQLRPEGRESIYLDDEVALACEISDLLRQARRRAIEECLDQFPKGNQHIGVWEIETKINALLEGP